MIQVESYLRNKDGTFVPVEDATIVPDDPIHIDGAMALRIVGVDIIDLDMWDLVDQLWAYIADMIGSLKETGTAQTHFPDQPIELKFQRDKGGRVVVTSTPSRGMRKAIIGEQELINSLRDAGLKFFHKMSLLVPANAATYQIYADKLSALPIRRSR